MVDAVTLGALNRIIRNNAMTFAAIAATTGTFSGAITATTGTFSGSVSGTTGTFTGAVTGSKFIASTVETATSSAVTLNNGGLSQIGTTLATTFVLSAPVAGVNKFIQQNIASTLANAVYTGSSLITFVAPLFPTAASSITKIVWGSSLAAGCSVELQAISATQWAVVGNNSTAITFTT